MVLDDLAQQVCASNDMCQQFLVDNHHRNISTLFLSQNLFQKGRFAREISLNCHYFVLMKNLRDINQIEYFSRQVYGKNAGALVESYKDAISKPYGYLVVDLSPSGDDDYRLRSDIFPGQHTVIYQKKS